LDVLSFKGEDGLVWVDSSGRNREMPEWRDYVLRRASIGRMVPRGFSKSGKFK